MPACDGRSKFHVRIAATGSVDEANAFIGWAARHVGETMRPILRRIQNDLFDIGADLAERRGELVDPLREPQPVKLGGLLARGLGAVAKRAYFSAWEFDALSGH